MLNEVRTKYGDMVVMCAVPAFMMTPIFLPAVTTGAGGDRVRRIDPAGERVDVLLRQQLLHRDLGVGARGILVVALDDVDLVGLELVGPELEVLLHAAVDLLAELGADAGERRDQADLDLLRAGQRGRHGERGRRRENAFHHRTPSQIDVNRRMGARPVSARILGPKPEASQASGMRRSARFRRILPRKRSPFSASSRRRWGSVHGRGPCERRASLRPHRVDERPPSRPLTGARAML